MNRKLFVAALVLAAAIPLGGRTTDTPLQEAAVAWDRGDYATALKTYLQILDSLTPRRPSSRSRCRRANCIGRRS